MTTAPRYQGKYRIESTRLPDRDYAANGWYFVTICTRDRQHFFGEIIASQMQLSLIGKIAQQFWVDIPGHFNYIHIDTWVVMPNHVHGIIVIDRPAELSSVPTPHVETLHATSLQRQSARCQSMSDISPNAKSLGAIVRSYKSAVTHWCRKNDRGDFGWQTRFYEHIIRADGSLDRIRQYIIDNPAKWESDKNNPTNLWM
ncbi:MAG: transposase [Cyanosarcina radialis HA8281-LM2]|jgi:REP element-mobilizing transposase RayT|nr:transposase [Cyanosarcina radialis HA8281-LM2]